MLSGCLQVLDDKLSLRWMNDGQNICQQSLPATLLGVILYLHKMSPHVGFPACLTCAL